MPTSINLVIGDADYHQHPDTNYRWDIISAKAE